MLVVYCGGLFAVVCELIIYLWFCLVACTKDWFVCGTSGFALAYSVYVLFLGV